MTAFFKGHKEMKQIEILAPAGSYASLKAALASGADAVYVGGDKFGARAYGNLTHLIDMQLSCRNYSLYSFLLGKSGSQLIGNGHLRTCMDRHVRKMLFQHR